MFLYIKLILNCISDIFGAFEEFKTSHNAIYERNCCPYLNPQNFLDPTGTVQNYYQTYIDCFRKQRKEAERLRVEIAERKIFEKEKLDYQKWLERKSNWEKSHHTTFSENCPRVSEKVKEYFAKEEREALKKKLEMQLSADLGNDRESRAEVCEGLCVCGRFLYWLLFSPNLTRVRWWNPVSHRHLLRRPCLRQSNQDPQKLNIILGQVTALKTNVDQASHPILSIILGLVTLRRSTALEQVPLPKSSTLAQVFLTNLNSLPVQIPQLMPDSPLGHRIWVLPSSLNEISLVTTTTLWIHPIRPSRIYLIPWNPFLRLPVITHTRRNDPEAGQDLRPRSTRKRRKKRRRRRKSGMKKNGIQNPNVTVTSTRNIKNMRKIEIDLSIHFFAQKSNSK